MPHCSNNTDESFWDCSEHPKYTHAESWDQVCEWLDRGLDVLDPDGDHVRSFDRVIGSEDPKGEDPRLEVGRVALSDYSDSYNYAAKVMLLSEPPVSQEEEDEAIQSILKALH